MALNSTPRRRFGVALGVVLTGVAAGLIGFAGTASAHIPDVNAGCKGETTTLNVKLTHYVPGSKGKTNTVTVLDGDTKLVEKDFRDKFEQKFELPGDVDHKFKVIVKAWDDPDGKRKWSFTKELPVPACVTPTSSSTPPSSSEPPSSSSSTPPSSESSTPPSSEPSTPPSSETTSPSPTPSVPETTVTTTKPPVVKEEGLAETGASVGLPLGIGGVLLVGGVVLLFVVKRRSKA